MLVVCLVYAQGKRSSKNPPSQANGIAGKTAGMQKFEGYFDFYYDDKNDKIMLVIDKIDQEFLYVNSLAAGVGSNDIGLDRNQLGSSRIVKFDRRGPKVLMVQPNYKFRAISNNELERAAVRDAFAQSVLWGFKVITEENGQLLVDATDFFMRDSHNIAGRLKNNRQGNYSLDKSRSAFYLPRTKNFPKNSEIEATITYKGTATGGYIRSVTPTSGAVTVRLHHSFVELPDSNYTPRKYDPRGGYFGMSYYDYATPISESLEKRVISRHRLYKKDPSAAVSEAVEPIIYYLDSGTPEPIRSALLDGARWWNQAFEAAGYKDAFQVKLLPADADPMDVRYNVINWVHRSTRGWSYGSSVRDPRTGEIIKGHVSLGSLRVRQDFLIAEGLLAPYENGTSVPTEMQEMALARLRQLSAHEVGHTIGLAHSYASSSEGNASVMDYPHPIAKIKEGKIDLSEAYDTKIGAWDKVSVAFGYQHFPEGANESQELEKIIQNSLSAGLTFLSDQDARSTGSAHPYAHLWDNGKNASDELARVLDVRSLALKQFGENNIRKGTPYARLEEVLAPLYFFHRYQTEATAKIVGGLNYRYALRGDGQLITEMIDPAVQNNALDNLIKTLSPEVLALPESIIAMIPPRHLGASRGRELIRIRTGLTFDPLGAAESASDMTLSLLFNSARAQRLVEYHSRNSKQPGLHQVVDKVVNSTIKGTRNAGFSGEIQRVVDKNVITNLITLAANQQSGGQVEAILQLKLDDLKKWLSTKSKGENDPLWKAHYNWTVNEIVSYQNKPEDYESPAGLTPPDGSPIGMEWRCDFK